MIYRSEPYFFYPRAPQLRRKRKAELPVAEICSHFKALTSPPLFTPLSHYLICPQFSTLENHAAPQREDARTRLARYSDPTTLAYRNTKYRMV